MLYTDEERNILLAAKKIIKANKRSLLRDIIRDETGFDILPMTDELKSFLEIKCEEFIQYFNQNQNSVTHSRYGLLVENAFRDFCKFNRPKGSGYPDCEVPEDMFALSPFVENKTYSVDSVNSPLRTFYYNSFNKITRTTYHVLVGFEFGENENGKYLTGNYHVVDLYNKSMVFRMEINAGNSEIYG